MHNPGALYSSTFAIQVGTISMEAATIAMRNDWITDCILLQTWICGSFVKIYGPMRIQNFRIRESLKLPHQFIFVVRISELSTNGLSLPSVELL